MWIYEQSKPEENLSLLPQADKDSVSMATSPVQAIRLLFRIFIKPPLLRVILSFL